MTRVLHIPAASREVALKVAYAIEAGKVPCLGQYLDAGRARGSAETLSTLHRSPFQVFTIVVETVTHDDRRIPVARIINGIGEIAAALLIVIGGCWIVGKASFL